MIPLYRTNRMEDCIIALDAAHEKVMARAIHRLANPIRLRLKKLQDIRPFVARENPAFDSQIEQWKEECGTLVNYRRFLKSEPTYDYDACFLCETPLSIDEIEAQSKGAKALCVLYKPPVWRAHEETLFAIYPTGTSCKRFMQAVWHGKPTKEYASIALACGIPTAGTHALDDDALAKELSLSLPELGILRKRAMRSAAGRRYSQVVQLIPRIEPDDKTLHEVYRFIKNELPTLGHIRLARDNALAKSVRYWKTAMRALVRSGSVEQRARTCFYFIDGLAPDYAKIEAEHQAARARFEQLRSEVDSLPEFLSRQEKALPSDAHAPRESAVHFDDTAH